MTSTQSARVGRYRLLRRIGEGGMGVVHLAEDEQGHAVALKVLRPHVAGDPDARRRLAREVDTLLRVDHPLVAAVLDADVECDTPYVVTEYVDAPPLDAYVAEQGPLGRDDLLELGEGLVDALDAIHAAGVVHRDLKPGNVLFDGGPVVIDFGIAHVADDVRLTSTGLVMGTPGYLSPEVAAGRPVTAATDWWGWAATMAFAATGRPPFGRGPVEVVLDRVRRGDHDLDGAPQALLDVLVDCLDPDPRGRPRPVDLREALEDLAADDWEPPAADTTRALPAFPPTGPVAAHAGEPLLTDRTYAHGTYAEPPQHHLAPPPYGAQPVHGAQPYGNQAQPYGAQLYGPQPYGDQPYGAQSPYGVHPAHDRQPPPGYAPSPWDAPHLQEPPPRPPRTGTLATGLLALAAAAAVVPLVAVVVAFAGSVLARTVDRAQGSLLRRRHERGPRRSDVVWSVVASPAYLVRAVFAGVSAAVLPLLVGAAAALSAGWATEVAGVVVPGGGERPLDPVSLGVGALAAVLTGWWGPGGGSLRRGTRSTVRALAPGRLGARVVVVVLLLVVVAAVLLVLGGAQPDWAPLPGPPFGG